MPKVGVLPFSRTSTAGVKTVDTFPGFSAQDLCLPLERDKQVQMTTWAY